MSFNPLRRSTTSLRNPELPLRSIITDTLTTAFPDAANLRFSYPNDTTATSAVREPLVVQDDALLASENFAMVTHSLGGRTPKNGPRFGIIFLSLCVSSFLSAMDLVGGVKFLRHRQ